MMATVIDTVMMYQKILTNCVISCYFLTLSQTLHASRARGKLNRCANQNQVLKKKKESNGTNTASGRL